MDKGVTINRPPRDGNMAFIKSPDGISIELLQKGPAKENGGALGLDAEYRHLVGSLLLERASPRLLRASAGVLTRTSAQEIQRP